LNSQTLPKNPLKNRILQQFQINRRFHKAIIASSFPQAEPTSFPLSASSAPSAVHLLPPPH
jgi:hypothetical protein